MPKYHLFGHMDRNFVKKGDVVKAYKTPLGTIGNANSATSPNNMYAHLHHEISSSRSIQEMISYINGKGLKFVQDNYINPHYIDYDLMFGRKMDVGKKGYDFCQKIATPANSYHPGIDINGANTSGNQDFGWQFKSPISGKVVYEIRTNASNKGWGNLIIIEEEVECSKCCKKHCGI